MKIIFIQVLMLDLHSIDLRYNCSKVGIFPLPLGNFIFARYDFTIFSSSGQSPGRAIEQPPASALAKSLTLKFFM